VLIVPAERHCNAIAWSLACIRLCTSCCAGLFRQPGSVRVYAVAAVQAPKKVDVIREAHGFVLERDQFIKEYDSHVLLYKHKKTGAQQAWRVCCSQRP
jgi:hypothetical protein